MANLTQTIRSHLGFVGGQPSTKWGFTWGGAPWGDGNDLQQAATKVFQSYGITLVGGSFVFDFVKRIVLSSFVTPLSETITETLKDPADWNFVFPGQVIDNDDRIHSNWTDLGDQGTGWVSSLVTSTPWSGVL